MRNRQPPRLPDLDDAPEEALSAEEEQDVIATNRAIRLSCTLAAMMGLFGLFLCFAERESRAIRHYAVRSAALLIAHVCVGLFLLALGFLLGSVPYVGYVVQFVGWLVYIAMLIALIAFRIYMMYCAWQGWRCRLPVGDAFLLARFGV